MNNIIFQEDFSFGYKNRTIKNAGADATIAIASDFNSAGEKLTKKCVLEQNKKYISIDISENLSYTKNTIDYIVSELNSCCAKTLNIAGNGIYTFKNQYTQKQLDSYVYQLLSEVINSKDLIRSIENIRTGGQTGIDEAGAKASNKLGINTLILAPKGYKFRNINGQDIPSKKLFKQRFD